jgi:gamma-glutamyltranspeptidase/glutathione hydrolase
VLRPRDPDWLVALGSGGSKRIRSAISQVIGNMLDMSMPLAEAVERARMHWEDGRLQLEPGLDGQIEAVLRERFDVNLWERKGVYFGGVNAVAWPPDAAADSRRGGAAMIVTE